MKPIRSSMVRARFASRASITLSPMVPLPTRASSLGESDAPGDQRPRPAGERAGPPERPRAPRPRCAAAGLQ
eukprot:1262727-Pyramimonas_sp.AAC.1